MAIGDSDKAHFVTIASALLYAQHAGIICLPQTPVEAKRQLAEECVTGAEVLFEALQRAGYVEAEQP